MQQGNIGVTSENIFPVIKKFLYSDHEIFLRELVSNAVDATQKLKTLSSVGEYKGELKNPTVYVKADKSAGTLTISDSGIGMTADEIDKYINQIAFSGAGEFLDKYKDNANAIIGHFGLGFYSAFMVSKKVEIFTKSYKDGAQAVHWSCEGNPSFEIEDCNKEQIGTDIVLHIDDDSKEFLEDSKIQELLTKYCKFLPVPIAFGKKKEWKDGKEQETAEDNVINNTTPAWIKKPADLKEEDYTAFYRELYPYAEEPLFHIHLNVDYPFNLTGILYFPKVKNTIELQKNKIQLYCNQVFVTDSVEGIVPDFLTLLHGVIDSPDIPLNVSRSYLQSDSNVKKISAHITKKVSDSLMDIFKKDRKEFEKKWESLKIFISYGMLTEDKFYDRALGFNLFTTTDGDHYTYEEYKKLVEGAQTDKDGNVIFLYAANKDAQYSYIEAAKAKGYSVLLFNDELDVHLASKLEQKNEKTRYVRVDSDTIDRLIVKEDAAKIDLTDEQKTAMTKIFSSQAPKTEKEDYIVSLSAMGADAQPIIITQNEFMRRMKEMSRLQGGMMGFYGDMPNSYTLVLNTDHKLIKDIVEKEGAELDSKVAPLNDEIAACKKQVDELKAKHKDLKEEEKPEVEKDIIRTQEARESELEKQKTELYSTFAASEPKIKQLIDLALLANGMLKGEALSEFVKRSVNLL